VNSSFDDRVNSPEMRYAYQLTYSMRLLSEIAIRYETAQDDDDLVPAMAMLDAFYVHLRLVAEFLTRSTSHLDFGPMHFGVIDWEAPQSEAAIRLRDYWTTASQFVVHFGHARVPETLDELQSFEVSGSALKAMASDALDVLDPFVSQVRARAESEPAASVEQLRAQLLQDELGRSRSRISGT
jgi:hypothetical protein